jgi:hypothetical protein
MVRYSRLLWNSFDYAFRLAIAQSTIVGRQMSQSFRNKKSMMGLASRETNSSTSFPTYIGHPPLPTRSASLFSLLDLLSKQEKGNLINCVSNNVQEGKDEQHNHASAAPQSPPASPLPPSSPGSDSIEPGLRERLSATRSGSFSRLLPSSPHPTPRSEGTQYYIIGYLFVIYIYLLYIYIFLYFSSIYVCRYSF